MALTSTTLAAAIGSGDLQIRVTSATGFAVGNLARIDDEFVSVTAVSGTVITVRRGLLGTAQVAHNILASVDTGLPGDFPDPAIGKLVPVPPDDEGVITYGAAGAVTIPKKDTLVLIAGGSATALTLADPSVAIDGRKLTFMAATAQAHTVTNTTGFNNGGTASDVATFGGALGDNMTVRAVNGVWCVEDLRNVTLG